MSDKIVACCARVSTDDQSTGLESQVRILKHHCEANRIQNFEFFTDEGISGTKANRPSLDRLMLSVERGEISSVVVYSLSERAAMKREEAEAKAKIETQSKAEQELRELGVAFPEITGASA